jgi:quercetin dioxygenase-like cupin family protein
MKHINYLDAEPIEVDEAGAHGTRIRTLIGEQDGATNFFMRVLSMEPGAQSPNHQHNWEHQLFILSGGGTVEVDGKRVSIRKGDALFIQPNAKHNIRATEAMELI